MRAHLSILKSLAKNFHATGTIFPSSSFLAACLCREMRSKAPLKILEVGAGTGAITKTILDKMSDSDHLTICEMNHDLLEILKEDIKNLECFTARKGQIAFFDDAIQNLNQTDEFDLIICSLPFLNFPSELAEDIFQKLHKLAKANAKLSYFSYLGGGEVGSIFSSKRAEVAQFLKKQNYFSNASQAIVWRNLLPAQVYFLQKNI